MTIYILLVENGCKDNSFLTLMKVIFLIFTTDKGGDIDFKIES